MVAKGSWSNLKGEDLLLFQQWQTLNDTPGMRTYDRMWAVFAIYRTLRGLTREDANFAKQKEEIEKQLHVIFHDYEQFEQTPGAFAVKGNGFMDKLADAECEIWNLTVDTKRLKDASMPDFGAPFILGGSSK
jgi:hypothetical protein